MARFLTIKRLNKRGVMVPSFSINDGGWDDASSRGPVLIVRQDGTHFYAIGEQLYVSQSTLKKLKILTAQDLETLPFVEAPNPHRSGANMKLYNFKSILDLEAAKKKLQP